LSVGIYLKMNVPVQSPNLITCTSLKKNSTVRLSINKRLY